MDFLTNKKTGEAFPIGSEGVSSSDFHNKSSDVIESGIHMKEEDNEHMDLIHDMVQIYDDERKKGERITKDEMRLKLFEKGYDAKSINEILKQARTVLANDNLDFSLGWFSGSDDRKNAFNIHHRMDEEWDKLSESDRKNWLDAIGFYHHYADTKWKNIPYTVQNRIMGNDFSENIETRWSNLTDDAKRQIIGETYHGGMAEPIVKELMEKDWDKMPSLFQNEIKGYLKYGNRY